MAFTMHSHSGQFCPGHAQDQLEDIIKHAISIGYKTMGLTEHMPRTELADLYPEELEPDPHASLAELRPRHTAYLAEARRLQAKYASQIHLLIGFEGEWLRPAYGPLIEALVAEDASIDYFIGSVHHAGGGVPIDLDKTRYARARDNCAAAAGVAAAADVDAAEAALYASYYDDQHAMLAALRPRVVGHVDLVRLLSEQPGRDVRTWAAGNAAGVWVKVVRNLRCVRAYGGWLECNTSALRKGLAEPYPARAIAEEWIRLGGRFTFSDDSHGIAQVATHYSRGLDFLESLGVNEVMTLERRPHAGGRAELVEKSVSLVEFRASLRC